MGCVRYQNCGGCVWRELDMKAYREKKEKNLRELLEQNLGDLSGIWQPPVFIKDGSRRRAAFAFEYKKQKLSLGFNENKSASLVDISDCLMLTEKINASLSDLKNLLEKLCAVTVTKKMRGKKFVCEQIKSGDVLVLDTQNGLDVVLETELSLSLDHRMEICDFMNAHDDFIRFSWRSKHAREAEPIVEKTKPFIQIKNAKVFVSAGDFLQASKEGEETLISLALDALGNTRGRVADLFCGIGTFSYALSALDDIRVVAADINPSLLKGFKDSLDTQMIQNVEICEKNLFLYPFSADELKDFDVILFDPPRAGALAQVKEICKTNKESGLKKIIAVSCCPQTFARDAKLLCQAGFVLKKITMADQFVYSNHSEIVALFTNEK